MFMANTRQAFKNGIRASFAVIWSYWVLLLLLPVHSVYAQATLSLAECQRLARAHYPAIKKLDLISRTAQFDVENANRKFLPQLLLSGQATYQSQTISFSEVLGSLPAGADFPALSKDQYKVQAELNQLLYDGGNNRYQKQLLKANAGLQEQNLEVTLYALEQRINDIYFAILLMDAQLKQNELNQASLQTQVEKTKAALANGIAFRSHVAELEAEILNIGMAGTEYRSNRTAYLEMLSLFTGKDLSAATQLELPPVTQADTEIRRPELQSFAWQKSVFDAREKQLKADYLPRVSAFFQGAYGRPTLNIIENKAGPWYIAGLRFNWSLSSLYTLHNQKKIINLGRLSVDADKETFLLHTRLDLTRQDEQVKKYTELIAQDEQAIALRRSVTISAEAQLSNGVITMHEYIQKVNAEHLARQSLILHQVQRLQARYNQQFITGK